MGHTGVALEPLWRRLAELRRQGTVLHADETPVPQPDPDRRKTKTRVSVGVSQQCLGKGAGSACQHCTSKASHRNLMNGVAAANRDPANLTKS
jgi:hypothetical protein